MVERTSEGTVAFKIAVTVSTASTGAVMFEVEAVSEEFVAGSLEAESWKQRQTSRQRV
jgi:hypothetical protein